MKTCTTINLSTLLAALDRAKRQARPESATWDITLTNGECLEELKFIRDDERCYDTLPPCPFCGLYPNDDNDPVARRIVCETPGCAIFRIGVSFDAWFNRAAVGWTLAHPILVIPD